MEQTTHYALLLKAWLRHRLLERQRKIKRAALALAAFGPDLAAVAGHKLAAEVEPEAEALALEGLLALSSALRTFRAEAFTGATVGLALALLQTHAEEPWRTLLLFGGFMIFNFMTNLGPNAQTYLLAGEVFPTNIRGKGAGFAAAFAGFAAAVGLVLAMISPGQRRQGEVPAIPGYQESRGASPAEAARHRARTFALL